MSKSLEVKNQVVAGALVGAGAVVAAIGSTDLVDRATPLIVVGSALTAVGLAFLLAVTALSMRQRATMGAVLTAVGTSVAVFATNLNLQSTMLVISLTGGAVLTAGVLQILQAVLQHEAGAVRTG